MNKKVIIAVIVTLFLLAASGVGVYLATNPQDFFPSAEQTANTPVGQACPAPATPATVTLSYPFCEVPAGGTQESCQFERAGCTWEAVSSATKYNIKVTEVETGATVSQESINAPTTKTSFPVVQGRTYKCEVSAVSSCGTVGGTNSDTLLCQTDAFIPSPAPASTPPPAPVVIPSPVPTPTPIACGFSGCSTSVPCAAGYICVSAGSGVNYCARSEYQSACAKNPGEAACCQAPVIQSPPPVLPKAGLMDNTLVIGGVGIGLVILGVATLLLL